MSTSSAATPAAQAPFTAERWQQFWNAWKKEPQQLEGVELLRQAVISADPAILTEAAPWRKTFSSAPPAPEAPAHANPLQVAWENQNDNASGTGYRECFSSSCAMLARFWGKVGSDDEYNAIRAKYGDSTSAEAQLSALRSLGCIVQFIAICGERVDVSGSSHYVANAALGPVEGQRHRASYQVCAHLKAHPSLVLAYRPSICG